jgi:hypothetical protein
MGYRNLLLTQVGFIRGGVQYPRPGVAEPMVPPNGYHLGDVVLIEAIVQYPSPVIGKPPPPRLPFQPLQLRKLVPDPMQGDWNREKVVANWDDCTNEYGSAILRIYLMPGMPAGTALKPVTWAVDAHLWKDLPNGTGDGDRVSLQVVAG